MYLESISGANRETSRQEFKLSPSKWAEIMFKNKVSKHLEELAVTNSMVSLWFGWGFVLFVCFLVCAFQVFVGVFCLVLGWLLLGFFGWVLFVCMFLFYTH